MKKKIFSLVAVFAFVISSAVLLTACSKKTRWVLPSFSSSNEQYKIEGVTNVEKDFQLPIAGVKYDHSNYEREKLLEYGWVIKNSQNEVVGWIETNNSYDTNKGLKYGYSTATENGKYCFSDQTIVLILKSTDVSIFDNVTFTSNIGTLTKEDSRPATERYTDFDQQLNKIIPKSGSENFVCGYYTHHLSDLNPKNIKEINYSLSIPALS